MARELRKLGYDAYALQGGYNAWRDAGLPLAQKTGEEAHFPTP